MFSVTKARGGNGEKEIRIYKRMADGQRRGDAKTKRREAEDERGRRRYLSVMLKIIGIQDTKAGV